MTQIGVVPPTDTLTFTLTEEQIITNNTVKIVVSIHALKASNTTETELKSEIKQTVRSFIDTPDWQFSPPQRETQPTGNETITLIASVRVSESENYSLKERADRVSRPGLTLSGPAVDNTNPNDLIQATGRELRMSILRRAMDEAIVMSEQCPSLVLHNIQFGSIASDRATPPPSARPAEGAFAPPPTPAAVRYSSVGPRAPSAPKPSTEDIMTANSTRVHMTATVILRRISS